MPRLKAAFGGLGFREPEVRGPATKEPRHLGDVVSSLVESGPRSSQNSAPQRVCSWV